MTSKGGAGYGVIFAIDMDGNNYEVLHKFASYPTDGAAPYGALTLVGSKLYGMTSEAGSVTGGVIFEMNPSGSGYKVIFNFGGAGLSVWPRGSLTLSGSKFYGMTYGGGPDSNGVIFRINPDGTGFKILHGFMSYPDDGGGPLGDLTFSRSGNTLYGTTSYGGSGNGGVVFSYQMGPEPQSSPAITLLLMD
jgi:uncharacterized repeat protein (TIGR03803 family)